MKEHKLNTQFQHMYAKKRDIEKELEELKLKLFKNLCPKGYKDECEPAYCIFRITNSCDYVKFLTRVQRQSI